MNLEIQWAFWPKKSWHWKSEFDINEEVFEALTWYQYQLHIMSFIEIHELFQKIPISAAVTSDSFFFADPNP